MEFFDEFDGPKGVVRSAAPGFSELADAAFDETLMLRNVGGESQAYLRAYADINRRVKQGFGVDLPNPMTDWTRFDPATGTMSRERLPERYSEAERAIRDWHAARLADLQRQNPDRFRELRLDEGIEARTTAIMREALERSQDLNERASGLTATLAGLWGGLKALPYDPVQVASLPFGPGKTLIGRVAGAAGVNAAAEAVSYPLTTGQKERAGLATGAADFAGEVATAALFGAAFQGGAEAAGAALRAGLARWRGSADPAERGAAAAVSADLDMIAARPAAIPEAEHARAVAETVRYLEEPDAPAPIFPDPLPEARPALPDILDAPGPSSFSYLDKPVQRARLDPLALEFEPERFQYKGGGDARGVTDRLAGVDRWDDLAAQAIVVYEFADGRRVVADGHQRTGLAQRLVAEGRAEGLQIDAFVLREADGWTPDEAFAVATKRNLQQGTGDVTDTAVALQRLPGILDKSVARGSAHMRTAVGLAKLDPELLGMVRAGALSQEAGKVIGYKLADPVQQRAAVDAIQRLNLKGEETISGFIDEMKAAGARSDVTFDLFGDQEIARSLAVEMAELKVKVADLLKQNAKAFKRVNDAADLLEARRNVLVRDVNARVASTSGEAAAFVQSLSVDPGPMRDILMEGARRVAAGEKAAVVARDTANRIAAIAEAEGIEGLVPRAPATVEGAKALTPRIDAPAGPEAKARVDALERELLPPPQAPRPARPTSALAGARTAPRPLGEPPRDNYGTKLSAYSDRLYREVGVDDIGAWLPTGRQSADLGEIYFSHTADLALGQGRNRGFLLEVDPAAFRGQINRSKPAWEIAWRNGEAEFRGEVIRDGIGARESVLAVEVRPHAYDNAGSRAFAISARRSIAELEASGWTKTVTDDGAIRLERPPRQPDAPAARTAEPGADDLPQLLLDGVAPVTDRQRLDLEAARPMRGGDAAPPEGGLFDLDARDQAGLFDLVPGADAGRIADGTAAAAPPRTRAQVADELARLDAEATLLDACLKKG